MEEMARELWAEETGGDIGSRSCDQWSSKSSWHSSRTFGNAQRWSPLFGDGARRR